jgi:hypothetical protein
VEPGATEALRDTVLARYRKLTGLIPQVYPVATVDGAGVIG